MLRTLHILLILLGISFSLPAAAQSGEPPADAYLTAAVEALGANDHELGLQLLTRAAARSTDPRITYYTAFALEKLGRCGDARRKYREAEAAGPARYTAAAVAALQGFDARCINAAASAPDPVVRVRPVRRSPTLATVGWVLTTVGALTLVAFPVKYAFDHEVATQSEQYFEQVYECDVDFGQLADDCDAAAVKANPQWDTYAKRVDVAKKSNVWMLAASGVLLAGGITAVLVGSTRVSAVAVLPTPDGALVTVQFDFR